MRDLKDILLVRLNDATKKQPVDRYEEAIRLGVDERTVRGVIKVLRMEGHRVCSDSKGRGYWLAEGEDDYKNFRGEYIRRAKNILHTVHAMDESIEGQIGGLGA